MAEYLVRIQGARDTMYDAATKPFNWTHIYMGSFKPGKYDFFRERLDVLQGREHLTVGEGLSLLGVELRMMLRRNPNPAALAGTMIPIEIASHKRLNGNARPTR
ncbi:MAG: hypothetical protein OXR66_02940 [Candidatus Woesearchaeota archaeon]|nr:hypothetical protein [Candidatus Woesearchaeota archaeon]